MHWDQIKSRNNFLVKRKFFGLGTVLIYDQTGKELVLYAKAKFLKGEGFRFYTNKEMTEELLFAKRERSAGQGEGIGKDLSALKKAFINIYSAIDTATNETIGGFQRKMMKSMFRDTWLVLGPDGREIGTITEKSGFSALLSRIIILIPQKYTFELHGRPIAELNGKVSFFVTKYELLIKDPAADIRLIMTGAALIGGIESKRGQR